MGRSNAERMRKYRQSLKSDPVKYDNYLKNERDRYKRRKEKGEIKGVHDCTPREQKLKRRHWRIEKESVDGSKKKPMK